MQSSLHEDEPYPCPIKFSLNKEFSQLTLKGSKNNSRGCNPRIQIYIFDPETGSNKCFLVQIFVLKSDVVIYLGAGCHFTQRLFNPFRVGIIVFQYHRLHLRLLLFIPSWDVIISVYLSFPLLI